MFGRRSPDWPIWRIDLHYAGPDPRVALREDFDLSDEDVAALRRKLDRLDTAWTLGPWARATLELIRDRPEVRAPDLAASLGRETEVAQARRAQAQGARADGVAADRLPDLASRERAAGAVGGDAPPSFRALGAQIRLGEGARQAPSTLSFGPIQSASKTTPNPSQRQ